MLWLTPIFAFVGATISLLIYRSKTTGKPLVCAIGQDCNKVINSRYSRIFGLSNEVIGFAYFVLIFLLSTTNYFGQPDFFGWSWPLVMVIVSFPSAIFSVCLTWIQLRIINELCEYCLVTAAMSIGIFVVQLISLLG